VNSGLYTCTSGNTFAAEGVVVGNVDQTGSALSCTTTTAGALRTISSGASLQFCNGTLWENVTLTPPNGYFVLTSSTFTGNFGGLSGADSQCLTELTTTHTTWKGYSTALANGQLVSGNVHAFLFQAFGLNPPAFSR